MGAARCVGSHAVAASAGTHITATSSRASRHSRSGQRFPTGSRPLCRVPHERIWTVAFGCTARPHCVGTGTGESVEAVGILGPHRASSRVGAGVTSLALAGQIGSHAAIGVGGESRPRSVMTCSTGISGMTYFAKRICRVIRGAAVRIRGGRTMRCNCTRGEWGRCVVTVKAVHNDTI